MLLKKYFTILILCLAGVIITCAQPAEAITIIKAGNLIDPEKN